MSGVADDQFGRVDDLLMRRRVVGSLGDQESGGDAA
jgi:hypothetical protein